LSIPDRELKRTLPIWKKEFYVGGEHWIGDRSESPS